MTTSSCAGSSSRPTRRTFASSTSEADTNDGTTADQRTPPVPTGAPEAGPPAPTTARCSGFIEPIEIQEEMERSFLEYSMSVIVSRALPDVRDGLKPVHRRILYSMFDQNLRPDRPHVKCAEVVGEVMGTYHPHGDSAIYDALVRMVQDFSLRHPLIDGHGNFGGTGPRRGSGGHALHRVPARSRSPSSSWPASTRRRSTSSRTTPTATEEPTVLPARVPQPAGQRLAGDRRGHGHQHPAAQPGRGDRRHACTCSSTPTPPPTTSWSS